MGIVQIQGGNVGCGGGVQSGKRRFWLDNKNHSGCQLAIRLVYLAQSIPKMRIFSAKASPLSHWGSLYSAHKPVLEASY